MSLEKPIQEIAEEIAGRVKEHAKIMLARALKKADSEEALAKIDPIAITQELIEGELDTVANRLIRATVEALYGRTISDEKHSDCDRDPAGVGDSGARSD